MEKTDKLVSKILKRLICSMLLLLVFLNSKPAWSLSLISDEETEVFLHKTVMPIFNAANVAFSPNRIYIVNDKALNAFVADGNNMFINTGTLINADNQNQIIGILAHETGHIEGGHLIRHKIMAKEVQTMTLASMILGSIAGVAAGRADMSIAAILGSQGSAINNMLSYQISEERSADEAAVKLLKKINQSPEGMLNFMKKIQQYNKMQGYEEISYYRTHPVTTERITFLERAVKNSDATAIGPDEAEFQRIKAKLIAFIEEPRTTFIRYPLSDTSIPARYAHAVAYFKLIKMPEALETINGLIDEEPYNPYFHELKGQMLLETGKVSEAVEVYKKALKISPNSSLFKLNLAQAMIENNPSKEDVRYIINLSNQVLIYNPNSYAWLLLARAYGLIDDAANYNYAAAEYSYRMRDIGLAKRQAEAALKANPNSVLKLKIDDLLNRMKQDK